MEFRPFFWISLFFHASAVRITGPCVKKQWSQPVQWPQTNRVLGDKEFQRPREDISLCILWFSISTTNRISQELKNESSSFQIHTLGLITEMVNLNCYRFYIDIWIPKDDSLMIDMVALLQAIPCDTTRISAGWRNSKTFNMRKVFHVKFYASVFEGPCHWNQVDLRSQETLGWWLR